MVKRLFLALGILCCFSLFGGSMLSSAEGGIWPTGTATLCWRVSIDGETVTLRLRSFPIGEGNYLLSGKVLQGGILADVVGGNAVVTGTKVYILLHDAGRDTEATWTSTSHIVLASGTLNGNLRWIGHDYNNYDLTMDTEHGPGTLTKIQCP